MTHIHVIHENAAWLEPLAAALDRQGLPWRDCANFLAALLRIIPGGEWHGARGDVRSDDVGVITE